MSLLLWMTIIGRSDINCLTSVSSRSCSSSGEELPSVASTRNKSTSPVCSSAAIACISIRLRSTIGLSSKPGVSTIW